ncbi:MAG: hypothetical protein ACRECN_04475 [Methylocella sp.]
MPNWSVTGVNAPELEILVQSDDGGMGVVRDHKPNEWRMACNAQGWAWQDESRVVVTSQTLEAEIAEAIGDSLSKEGILEAFKIVLRSIEGKSED